MDHAETYLKDLQHALAVLDLDQIKKARQALSAARAEGKQIFVCGNGGSASTASHLATDLGKGASQASAGAFKVMSLTDNIAWITALANDMSYEHVFVEQLRNFAQKGDVLLAISASGNSPNVIKAVEFAKESGLTTLGWTGFDGGRLALLVDLPIVVDSHHMGRVEDVHIVLMHLVCYYFMES
jgi:D-sedoheptulose 7-phosphate isomerase